MKYEMKRPTTEAEAVEILKNSFTVLRGQIEFSRGERKKAWNGEFVDHVSQEATHALAWLADRHPQTAQKH